MVLASNLLAAVDFILRPRLYLGGYELSGEVGRIVIVGYGILFLMWQVPYFFAVFDPLKYRTSLLTAVLMQAIGLVGESILLGTIPIQHEVLRNSILRFIAFDGAGLLILVIALILVFRNSKIMGKNVCFER